MPCTMTTHCFKLLMTATAAHGALLAGCATAEPANPAVGMANPASVYCERLGGWLEIRKDADGAESGWCHLPDGRVVEEWALFRAAHKKTPNAGSQP